MARINQFIAVAFLVFAAVLPASAGVEPAVPQLDPRAVLWDSGGDVALARDGEAFYLVDLGAYCVGDGMAGGRLCVWGPLAFEGLEESWSAAFGRLPLLAAVDAGFDGALSLVTAVRADTILIAAISERSVLTAEIAVDGSRSASYINDIPCGASAVFDTVDAVLWFACGPVALMYETGAVVAYTGDFEEVAAQPAGGVLALVGGATPTAGLFDLTSGRTMQVGLPTGSTVMRAAVDPTRGVAVLLRTPCADPCEQVPPEEPDVVADPADLVDFWVTWVGWDGTVEDNFGIVSVGTGPPDKSYSRGNITTDGRVMVVAHPTRITHEFAPDAVGTPWVLVESDGMLRTPFSGTAVTDDLHLAWGGLVQLSYLDGQAEVTFWHLTDQGRFFDDAGQFESDIEAAADAGVTLGCGAEGTLFCPDEPITRAQMASFIARWQGLTLDTPDVFSDDDGSAHEAAINAVADAGITLGCSPSDPARFCPDDAVTRAQMATFIARAMGLPDDFSDHFTDDNSSPHERAIDAIATQGITLGCEPAGTLFCPDNPVLRKHAAAFLARAGL